ncbi:MAG: hypothetical protein ACUVXE_06575 [Anaerolineae bacterium]
MTGITAFTESSVESTALNWLKEVGGYVAHSPDMLPIRRELSGTTTVR